MIHIKILQIKMIHIKILQIKMINIKMIHIQLNKTVICNSHKLISLDPKVDCESV